MITFRTKLYFVLPVIFLAALWSCADPALGSDAKSTTVILARHGEKVADTEDPDLSDAGKLRAQELIRILGSAGITAVYTTPYRRTRDTARPLAEFLNLEPIEVSGKDNAAVAAQILKQHAGGVVFVSGHSNTIPEIVKALGAGIEPIEDWQYDKLIVVSVPPCGKATTVMLKYGEPTE
jgi:broad specificity phosphatase PhoE